MDLIADINRFGTILFYLIGTVFMVKFTKHGRNVYQQRDRMRWQYKVGGAANTAVGVGLSICFYLIGTACCTMWVIAEMFCFLERGL